MKNLFFIDKIITSFESVPWPKEKKLLLVKKKKVFIEKNEEIFFPLSIKSLIKDKNFFKYISPCSFNILTIEDIY